MKNHVFASTFDSEGLPYDGPWSEFSRELLEQIRSATCEPGKRERLPAWAPIELDGTRKNGNVRSVHALVFDFDACPQVELDRLRSLPVLGLVHTTASDPNPDGTRRARLVIVLDKPIAPQAFAGVRQATIDLFDLSGVDPVVKDLARLFYLGRIEGSPDREVHTLAGSPLPVDSLPVPPAPTVPMPGPAVARVATETSAYGARALAAECDKVRAAPVGQQNATLNAAGFVVGQLVAGGEIVASDARTALAAAGLGMANDPKRVAWTEADVLTVIDHGLADGANQPRSAPAISEAKPWSLWGSNDITSHEGDLLGTPQGDALQFAAKYSGQIRYLDPDRRWIGYTGTHWSTQSGTTRAEQLWDSHVADLCQWAAQAGDSDDRDKRLKFAKSKAGRKARDEALALSAPKLRVSREEFNQNADDLLCTPSGIVDLRTGELHPNDPSHMISQCTIVPYDPTATCPQFEHLTSKLCSDDPETIEWLWRFLGYCLTGQAHEDCMLHIKGPGGNGKSTFVNALYTILGSYSYKMPIKIVVATREDVHGTEYAALKDRRLVTTSEIERGQRMRESFIKDCTGGDSTEARDLYQRATDAQRFRPKMKLMTYGNYDLAIRGTDEGIWRRIKKLEALYRFPNSNIRDTLVTTEGAGILARAVRGARAWYEHGLGQDPKAIRSATESYRQDQDLLGQFLTNCCEFGDVTSIVPVRDLRLAYDRWCKESGSDHPVGPKEFSERLKNAGAEKATPLHGFSRWRGVRLVGRPGGVGEVGGSKSVNPPLIGLMRGVSNSHTPSSPSSPSSPGDGGNGGDLLTILRGNSKGGSPS